MKKSELLELLNEVTSVLVDISNGCFDPFCDCEGNEENKVLMEKIQKAIKEGTK